MPKVRDSGPQNGHEDRSQQIATLGPQTVTRIDIDDHSPGPSVAGEPQHELDRLCVGQSLIADQRTPGGKGDRVTDRRSQECAVAAAHPYAKLGLALLRHAWVNLDLVWAVALIGTGLLSLTF